jgi:hypothetical protein
VLELDPNEKTGSLRTQSGIDDAASSGVPQSLPLVRASLYLSDDYSVITIKSNFADTAKVAQAFLETTDTYVTVQDFSVENKEAVARIDPNYSNVPKFMMSIKPIPLDESIMAESDNAFSIKLVEFNELSAGDLFVSFQSFLGFLYDYSQVPALLESVKSMIKDHPFAPVFKEKICKFKISDVLSFAPRFLEEHSIVTLGDLCALKSWDEDISDARKFHAAVRKYLDSLMTSETFTAKLLHGLSERNNYIIRNRIVNKNKTYEAIGIDVRLTTERIRQICNRFTEEVKGFRFDKSIFHSLFNTIKTIFDCEHCFTIEELNDYGISENLLAFSSDVIEKHYTVRVDDGIIAFCSKDRKVPWLDVIKRKVASVPILPMEDLEQFIKPLTESIEKLGYHIPSRMIETIALRNYIKSDVCYFSKSMSLIDKYKTVLEHHFPDGLKLYKQGELDRFREKYDSIFGDDKLSSNQSVLKKLVAATSMIDRGTYVLQVKEKLPDGLAQEIYDFIIHWPSTIVSTGALMREFESELSDLEIFNKYHLTCVLKDQFGEFSYSRDQIYKVPLPDPPDLDEDE